MIGKIIKRKGIVRVICKNPNITETRIDMARISGVDLPKKKRVEYALTYIYGIGLHTSRKILDATEIDYNTRVYELNRDSNCKNS